MIKIQKSWPTLKRLLSYGKPYSKPLSIAVLMLWVAAGAEVLGPILISYFIDNYVAKGQLPLGMVSLLAISFIVLQFLAAGLHYYQALLFNRAAVGVVQKLRTDVMDAALRQPLSAFDTQQEIEEAARLASVHEDILRLPQGYETEVGERGVMLSGGQKQRISIARALLLQAEILILDDALSAVDGRTEHQILHNLRTWGSDRTVIISAHRLSALVDASEILVFSNGTVAERGNHEQLSSRPGWYRDMYRYQQLEAALDDVPADDLPVDQLPVDQQPPSLVDIKHD